ncbi:hypothetical protein [Saccharomonospora glauca]|uniref:Uncharacterized protein n=1 Tax=Saccharomonospora glauca K62 TaxID=928724 RepID=I1CXC8_9PSEU|nr:hypothetical protein [Saccharomonospora glauca]EIE97352.1 hypothetical protein SacglDRAFT_00397 [Saccharomonospora glauca K62]
MVETTGEKLLPNDGDSGMQLCPVVQLDLASAKTLADQVSIIQDLRSVSEYCDRLFEILREPEDRQDSVAMQAYWTAALVSYWRCFNTGKRFGLTEEDVKALPYKGEVVEYHRWLGDMRNKNVAHSVNPFEMVKVGAVLSPDGVNPREVQGTGVFSARYVSVDEGGVQQLASLARGLAELVSKRAETQQEVVLEEARKMEFDRLRRMPQLGGTIPSSEDAARARK